MSVQARRLATDDRTYELPSASMITVEVVVEVVEVEAAVARPFVQSYEKADK